jgi:hypothetical protein
MVCISTVIILRLRNFIIENVSIEICKWAILQGVFMNNKTNLFGNQRLTSQHVTSSR